MVMLRKIAAWGVVGFAALVVVFFAMPMYRQGEPTVAGKTAQDFPTEIDGKPGRLSDLRGKVVVLNFWATWCPPCVEEMPALVQMQHRLKDKDVVLLGVSLDVDGDAYHKFLKDHSVDFLTVRDSDQKSNNLYGTFKFPETYIIDRSGIVRRKFIGPVDWMQPEILDFLTRL